jgi:hypothetical protein
MYQSTIFKVFLKKKNKKNKKKVLSVSTFLYKFTTQSQKKMIFSNIFA